jgi:hypothetical protein
MWIVALLVLLFYVHLFNRVASLYFASDRTLSLQDLWSRWIPYRIVLVSENGPNSL